MNSPTFESELETWRPAGHGARIEYTRAILEELSIAATDGYNRAPHGGVEIGGVLFGSREPDGVRIVAQRALTCEHALGPSFTLSDYDRRALTELLQAPNSDPELAGMQPVGWYLSHNRSDLPLSEKDIQLFDQYFPESWQITLVLRPNRLDPVRARFFFREPDGSMAARPADDEFVIGLGAAVPSQAVPPAPEPAPAAAPAAPRAPAVAAIPLQPPRRRSWTGATLGATAAALCGVSLGVVFWVASARGSSGLSLRALDVGGQLQVEWTCAPRIVQQSESGSLEIEDGPQKVVSALAPEQLHAGSLTYTRTTGNVVARLTVRNTNRTMLTQMVRFLGSPVTVPAAPNASRSLGSAERTEPVPEPKAPARAERAEPAERSRIHPPVTPPPVTPFVTAPPAPAPRRHELVLPATAATAYADPSVPPPPPIAAVSPSFETTVPRLPAPAPPTPVPVKRADPLPQSGRMIWTGRLARGGTIQIFGDRASSGHVVGALPGEPVRVRVFPAELTQDGLRVFTSEQRFVSAPEAPGALNGWNQTVYVLNARQAEDIRILEPPGKQNAWKHMTLRAERSDHAIIVLRWDRVVESQP